MADTKSKSVELDEHSQTPVSEAGLTDIYFASYLHALGHKVQRVRCSGYQSEFFFKVIPQADFIRYHNGEPHPALSPRKLFDSFQTLRKLTRQMKGFIPGGDPDASDNED